VCRSIASVMQLECIPIPTKDQWEEIASEFERRAQFPHCLRAVDGKHIRMQYFFIDDEAFGLHKHLLRPYGGSNLAVKKRMFNYRLCRARTYVECTFGTLSNKWRIFHRPINVDPDFAVDIVMACVILHNFVRVEDTMTITGFEDLPRTQVVRGGLAANNIRNVLSDYFLTNVGALKWQMPKI
jgi:hypothetical protein